MKSGQEAEPEPYTSRARVLLNGLGADELLGGYGRHRTAFKAGGWPAVINEVSHRIEKVMLVRILTPFFTTRTSFSLILIAFQRAISVVMIA
jgi:asparagine synthetase B (glutamine-hydrolysing)